MMNRPLALVIACAAIWGCAPSLTGSAGDRPYRSYTTGSTSPPIATYGVPNTAGQLSMECVPAEQAVHLVIVDTETAQSRPVEVRVGRARLRVLERLDPPDGMATSRIAIPLRERVLELFAAGAGPMMIHHGREAFKFASGALPRQMIRDCLRFPR